MMVVDGDGLIRIGALISAAGVVLGTLFRGYQRYLRQAALEEALKALQQHHEEDVRRLK